MSSFFVFSVLQSLLVNEAQALQMNALRVKLVLKSI
jgi:hypothetical protein